MFFTSLLMLRFTSMNLIGFALLVVAWNEGYVIMVYEADVSHISTLILALFTAGLLSAFLRARQISAMLNSIKNGKPINRAGEYYTNYKRGGFAEASEILKTKLVSRVHPLRVLGVILVTLGLIGTVIGFIYVFSGMDLKTASDVNKVSTMVTTLSKGMGIALYTTLIGAIFSLWLSICCVVLEGGNARLYTATIEGRSGV